MIRKPGRPGLIRKPLDLPRDVSLKFLDLMRAYYAAPDKNRAEEITAEALHLLREHYSGRLRMSDVKDLFALARDSLGASSKARRAKRKKPQ